MKVIMKKFILGLMLAFISIATVSAQSNYAGSSRFTDNWSATLQGGVLTTFDNFYSGHTAMAPIAVLGFDKYITPWYGFGVEGRTLIGTGHGVYNSYTVFDAVNVSGYAKVNVLNAINYNGARRFFEPVVYTGLGWGHQTASYGYDHLNYMTWRSGVELNFNLGKDRAWAVVVNPSVVWGNPATTTWATELNKHNGKFEVTAGVVYHFKNSNGSHSFDKPVLYDYDEVARLNDEISALRAIPAPVPVPTAATATYVEKIVVDSVDSSYTILFDKGDSTVGDLLEVADSLKKVNGCITIVGSTSPEGSEDFNRNLALTRAEAVKTALVNAGIDANRITVTNDYSKQRSATIILEK